MRAADDELGGAKSEQVGIELTHDGSIGTVRLRRAVWKNSLTPEIARMVADRIASLPEDCRVLVVASEGDTFCAGADFAFLEGLADRRDADEIRNSIYDGFQSMIRAVARFPGLSIARVQGPAVGAGADLALACDYRIATPEAWFKESWINLGLVSALGAAPRLASAMGQGHALRALLTGERIKADVAHRLGVVHQVVDADALDREVATLADTVANKSAAAVVAMKDLVGGSTLWEWPDEALAHALTHQVSLLLRDDFPDRVTELKQAVRGDRT